MLILIIGFFVFAGLAALAGVAVFSPKTNFSSTQVSITFKGAANAAAGDDYLLAVTVRNGGKVKLTNVELTVQYPDSFQFGSSVPKAANQFNHLRFIDGIWCNENHPHRW